MKSSVLFCDGASRGNPGPSGWGFVLALRERVTEGGGREELATNNQMELRALVEALSLVAESSFEGDLNIYLDSKYVLEGASKYIFSWAKRDWKTVQGADVKNRDLWESIAASLTKLKSRLKIKWLHVPGHQGIPGNERCDQIASEFADGLSPQLFSGDLKDYPINLNVSFSSFSKDVYLSLVDGKLYRDPDWKSCEARIKGRRGVKYKKVRNSTEEAATLKAWGL